MFCRYLELDGPSLDNLEVFRNSTPSRGKEGTLFNVLDRCYTAFGRRRLRQWCCRCGHSADDRLIAAW